METVRSTPLTASGRLVGPLLLAAIGVLGMCAIWTIVGLIFDRQCGWMAVLTAVDIALLLRLARMAPGPMRAATCVVATLITVAAANWCIAAAQMGGAIGFGLIDSIQRLGSDHGQTLIVLANGMSDLVWYAVAALLALWWGR